jgi:hypothetical protein
MGDSLMCATGAYLVTALLLPVRLPLGAVCDENGCTAHSRCTASGKLPESAVPSPPPGMTKGP